LKELHAGLSHLSRLRARMVAIGFLADDPLLLMVVKAQESVQDLSIRLHYIGCNGESASRGVSLIHDVGVLWCGPYLLAPKCPPRRFCLAFAPDDHDVADGEHGGGRRRGRQDVPSST
jgi:hypothetical protein